MSSGSGTGTPVTGSYLFTQAELNTKTSLTTTAAQYLLAGDSSKRFIEEYCRQDFISAAQTSERVERHGSRRSYLTKHKKVTAVTTMITGFLDSSLSTETIDAKYFYVHDWGFELKKDYLADFFSVTYTAGTACPESIKHVALELAKRLLVPVDMPFPRAIQSYSSGGDSFNFIAADWKNGKPTGDDLLDSILNSYRYIIPRIG